MIEEPVNDEIRLLPPYRVLDLTDKEGSLCGKVLGDLGADVIKIEPPDGSFRREGPFYRDIPDGEKSLLWLAFNSNKRGITLDIETSDGAEIFRRLVTTADFVIESFPPGYMDKLDLGYSGLSKIKPDLIMVSITPFGSTGPYSGYKSCDLVAMAMGGVMYYCGDPDRAPLRSTLEQTYALVGHQAAAGALAALHYRQETGIGQHADVSIQECVGLASWLAPAFWHTNQIIFRRHGHKLQRTRTAVSKVWPCKDGYIAWYLITGVEAKPVLSLMRLMDEEGMTGDLKDVPWQEIDMYSVSQEQIDHWESQFGRFFLTHTKKDLYKESVERGLMIFPVYNFAEILDDPQLAARGFWSQVEHPELGESITYPGFPTSFNRQRPPLRKAPLVGEHNEEILVKELGFSKKDLALFKTAGII